jgi:hypothetical protein
VAINAKQNVLRISLGDERGGGTGRRQGADRMSVHRSKGDSVAVVVESETSRMTSSRR